MTNKKASTNRTGRFATENCLSNHLPIDHMKRGLQLDRVVLLGRTFEEYRRYFLLEPDRLIGKRVWMWPAGQFFLREANKLA